MYGKQIKSPTQITQDGFVIIANKNNIEMIETQLENMDQSVMPILWMK